MADSEEELKQRIKELEEQARADRKLFRKAAETLAEIDRGHGLTDPQADVLASLRIRVEGKERASLEDLLSAAGDISGKRDIGEVLAGADDSGKSEWPAVEEQKKDWPGL
ncbi:MAG TPA: hypothetical protein VHJ82_03680 [Actinomycetota bacterium]|nr:hypothetical protein [Actinomycetota bacterium]